MDIVVVMMVVVVFGLVTVSALVEQKGQHAQKAKLGVCVNSHHLLAFTALQNKTRRCVEQTTN